uniref:SPOR domain-containing protein n=1 Tax=uncultured Sphingomonas sp. TaxID=158754 RepID=UPI0035CB490C
MAALTGAFFALAPGITPALADVREGVDAWGRGEYKKAVDQWRPAANAGDADAQFNLGQAYTLGRGVPVDIAVAEAWFRKAALQNHIAAQAKLGLVLFDQGKRGDAAPWLEKAALHGEPRSQLVYGTMLYNGDGVAKDWPRAYAFLVRAAAANTPRASEVQAQMDKVIPVAQRQQGLQLAQQYEADAQRPVLPPEIIAKADAATIRATDLPPSSYDQGVGAKPEVIAMQPQPRSSRTHLGEPIPGHPNTYRSAPGAQVPRPIPPSRPAVVASAGGWRVQLGAFGDPNNARKLWAQVGGRFAGAEVRYVKSGALTRVLVGGYPTKGAALSACGSVKPCVPVAP